MIARRLTATISTLALLLASLAFFCTRTDKVVMHTNDILPFHQMDGSCMGQSLPSGSQLMLTFFQYIPASPAQEAASLITWALVAVFICTFFQDTRRDREWTFTTDIKELLRRARRRRPPLALALAFQRGILHPKRYDA